MEVYSREGFPAHAEAPRPENSPPLESEVVNDGNCFTVTGWDDEPAE